MDLCLDELLALHYLPDWNATLKEFNRVLKPGGTIVISTEHPFFDYLYFKSDKYFETEEVKATWGGFGEKVIMPGYRRPLEKVVSPFTDNGFLIEKIVEPLPVPEFEKADPKHYKELMSFPAFICLKAVKK